MSSEQKEPRDFDKAIVCSGHMIDAAGRALPRFPEAKAEAVREAIAAQLEQWQVSKSDLALCGGACGADMLFAEECLRRGTSVHLLLAEPTDDFVRNSVERAGEDWVRRFYLLTKAAEVKVLPPLSSHDGEPVSVYERVNLWLVESARLAASKLYALLIWNENPSGDGPGGTADFERKMRELGSVIAIINPVTIRRYG